MSVSATEDRLFELYRRYIGEPDSKRDVYLGFGLFFGGVALGLVGLGLFLLERSLAAGTPVWWLRRIAFAVGALGLPALLLGVVVLLPVARGPLYAAVAGAVGCLVAVAFFVSVYPQAWNVTTGQDYSTLGVTVYAAGLVVVVGAAGAALVTYQIERVSPEAAAAEDEAEAETVTDEQVERDIEEAMSNTELSWGGVQKQETRRLSINPDAEVDEADRRRFENAKHTATTHRSESVDDAVAGLKHLRGGEKREARSSGGVDDQTAALKQLREQKRQEAAAESGGGLLARVKALLGLD